MKLNEEVVKALPTPEAGNKVHYFSGAVLQGSQAPRGFGVRVTAGGAKSFVLNYRIRQREHRFTIGRVGEWSVIHAVREARTLRQRVDRGENPLAERAQVPKGRTVSDVLDDFVARHVRNKERALRSADAIESAFDRLVRPRIGNLGIYELRRSDVAGLLDYIEDESGPVMADRTRAYFHKAMNWYSERDDQFNLAAAFVKVEPRANPRERARIRVLSDDEIRIIWQMLHGPFGALVKTLLLTAQRRDEVARMSRGEIGADGIWVIPAERYKTKRPNFVPLSRAAFAVIKAQPEIKGCGYVFPSGVGTPFSAWTKSKAALDGAILATLPGAADLLPNWTLHDLRRTSKTLMARAGVRPDVSERVLGHVIAGVEGTYDRHHYLEEKRDAVERLAAMIESILMGKGAS